MKQPLTCTRHVVVGERALVRLPLLPPTTSWVACAIKAKSRGRVEDMDFAFKTVTPKEIFS